MEILLEKNDSCLDICEESLRGCCSIQDIIIPSTPIFNKYLGLSRSLNYFTSNTRFLKKSDREFVLYENLNFDFNGKKLKLNLDFYVVPVYYESEIENYFSHVKSLYAPPTISLMINGVKVQDSYNLKIPGIIPQVLFDQTTGEIIGYSNTFNFSLENYIINDSKIRISIVKENLQDHLGRDFLLKFHPGMTFNAEITN